MTNYEDINDEIIGIDNNDSLDLDIEAPQNEIMSIEVVDNET